MDNEKSRRIVFRLKKPLYDFISSFARETQRTMSDVIRVCIEDYYYRTFLGRRTPSTKYLEREFLKRYEDEKRRMKLLKEKPIRIKP